MGNYYQGRLFFSFREMNELEIHPLLDYSYHLEKLTRSRVGDGHQAAMKELFNYMDSQDNWFVNGLKAFTDRYGEYRIIWNGIDVEVDHVFDDVDNFFSISQVWKDDEGEEVELRPITLKELKSDVQRLFELNEEPSIRAIFCISVLDKGYCNDEGLTKLIELWSPYLDPREDYIGEIHDEDRTFKKDYFRNNESKVKHFSFCGEWCADYFPEYSCCSEHCLEVFNRGVRSGKEEILSDYHYPYQ